MTSVITVNIFKRLVRPSPTLILTSITPPTLARSGGSLSLSLSRRLLLPVEWNRNTIAVPNSANIGNNNGIVCNKNLLQKLGSTIQDHQKKTCGHSGTYNAYHTQVVWCADGRMIDHMRRSGMNTTATQHFDEPVPHKVRMQYVHFRLHENDFLLPKWNTS